MASQKYTILYGRLSQEDARMGDSNSIINQRLLLEKYATDNGFENAMFLADDGYSGTNFERPSWKKVIEMIEADEVKTLIVKDMSRLGREYLQVGQLTELYLPAKGVRFIAINDGVDSLVEGSTDFNPIRNWANELHAKDTSKKVRAVKKMQAERGERLGGRPPYGYRKKSSDSKEIVPNEETAPVVQRIFGLCASGKGPNQIARILTDEQILTPTNYTYQKTGKSHSKLDTTRPCNWSGSSVTGILDNKVYLGHTVGLRSTSLSYKNKKLIRKPESEQITVENTHPALITQEQWDIVQDVRQHKKRVPKQMDEPNIFSGLAFCADCGKPMVLHRASTMKKARYNFTCYTYGKRGKVECSPHHIRKDELCKIVLDDLQRVTHFARMKERQFAAYINQKSSKELRREMNALQKELDTMRKRDGELSMLFKRLYEDHVLQRITAEQFRMLSADYNAEQKTLQGAIPEKEACLEKLKASAANVEAFIEKAKRFTTIDQLTPELVRLFIQRIEIGERSVKYSRSSAQSIRIIYRDIGIMDSAMEPGELPPQAHVVQPSRTSSPTCPGRSAGRRYKADNYEGRQDFGDGDGSLIAHIQSYHEYYAQSESWKKSVIEATGIEGWEQDRAEREMILGEFVPYLKLHCNLSAMEREAQRPLQSGETLTPEQTAYFNAVLDYVRECRPLLNQGQYRVFPVGCESCQLIFVSCGLGTLLRCLGSWVDSPLGPGAGWLQCPHRCR